jgi:hypothetical protein
LPTGSCVAVTGFTGCTGKVTQEVFGGTTNGR